MIVRIEKKNDHRNKAIPYPDYPYDPDMCHHDCRDGQKELSYQQTRRIQESGTNE